jgi:hypothetical protein
MLAAMRHAFPCQKLSLQPRRGNAAASYRGRPRFFAEGLMGKLDMCHVGQKH